LQEIEGELPSERKGHEGWAVYLPRITRQAAEQILLRSKHGQKISAAEKDFVLGALRAFVPEFAYVKTSPRGRPINEPSKEKDIAPERDEGKAWSKILEIVKPAEEVEEKQA
jgi:hypothetical protein